MEGNVDSEDGLMGMTEDISTVDFDLVADGVEWCEQCKKLKQELQQLQEEHALNYNTLKKKIISTDLLIKKFKAKSEDHESQTKKLDETVKKCDQLQRESETLRVQLGSSLQQLEPLKQAKESMEAENRHKDTLIQTLQDRLTSAVNARLQYETLSKSNSCFKEKYEETKKENGKKIHTLEISNQKQEAQITKLKEDLKSAKSEHSLLLKKHRKLEQRLQRAVERLEKYWAILKTNGLLPKGDKKLRKENYLDLSGATDESQSQEEDTSLEEPKNFEVVKDAADSCDEEDLSWSFSPLMHAALSPLPPTPTICHRGDSIENSYHSNSSDEDMGEKLEKQILHSSPIRRSPRKHSIWKQLPQTKSSPSKLLKKKKSKMFAAASKLTFNENAPITSNRNSILNSYLGVSKENCNTGLLKDLSRDLSESDDEDLKTPRKVPVQLKTKYATKEISPLIRDGRKRNDSEISEDRIQCNHNMFRPISEDSNDSIATLNNSFTLTKQKSSEEKNISEDSNDSLATLNNGLALKKQTSSPKKNVKKSVLYSDSDSDSGDVTLISDPVKQNSDDHLTSKDDHVTRKAKNNDDQAKENQSNDKTDFSVPPRLSPQILHSPKNKINTMKSSVLTRSNSVDSRAKRLNLNSKNTKRQPILKYKPIPFVKGEVLNPVSKETTKSHPLTRNLTRTNCSVVHDSNSVEHETNSIEHKTKSVEHDTNSIKHEPNSVEQDTNSVKHKTNSVEHDTNSVEHDTDLCQLSNTNKRSNTEDMRLTRSKSLKTSPEKQKMLLRSKSEPSNVAEKINLTEDENSPESEYNRTKIGEKCKIAQRNELEDNATNMLNTGEISAAPCDNLSSVSDNNTQCKNENVDALMKGDKNFPSQETTNNENCVKKEVVNTDKPASSVKSERLEDNEKNGSIKKDFVDKKDCGDILDKSSANCGGLENQKSKENSDGDSDSVSAGNDSDLKQSDKVMDDSVWSPQRFTRAMSRQVSTGFVIKSLSIEKENHQNAKTKRNTLMSVDESIEEENSKKENLLGDLNCQNSGGDELNDINKNSTIADENQNENNKNLCEKKVNSENMDIKGGNSVTSNHQGNIRNVSQIDSDKSLNSNKELKAENSKEFNTHGNNVHKQSKQPIDSIDVTDKVDRVVSPEIAEIAGGSSSTTSRSATPASLPRSSSSSPMIVMSPLPLSPFRFITPLSPLPPSPTREIGLLSPLPEGGDLLLSGALVDVHHLSTSESETNTPVGTPVPFLFSSDVGKEKQNLGRSPCTFHSAAPSGVIHVKPKPSQQNTSKKSVDFEDSAEGTKQRRKRKSKDQTPVVDKKICTDENITKSQLPAPVVSLSFKVLEREMKNYLTKKNTTKLEDFVNRLLSKDEIENVMSFLIQWTTQALRCSEVDTLYLIHTSTANQEKTTPYFTDQESKLLSLFKYLIQQNIWVPLRQKLLEALWKCIFLPDIVPVAGRSSLCRFFTGLCRLEGDLEQVRVMFYTCMTSSYLSYATLGLAVVSVWPEVLYKSNTESNQIITVMEHCIMSKLRVDEKQKHDQMSDCYFKLCNWSFSLQSSVSLLKSLLHSLDVATKTELTEQTQTCNKALMFEILKGIELLLNVEDLVLFKTTFVQSALNITMQKWKSRKSETNIDYDLCIIRVVGSVLPRKKDITVRYVNDVIKKYLIPLLNCKYDILEVCTVEVILELSPLSPQLAFNTLYQWYRRNRPSVIESLKIKLEHSRQILATKVKFHCPPFS